MTISEVSSPAKTLVYYENGVNQMLKHRSFSKQMLDAITGEDINEYVEWRLSQGLAIGSVNRELQVLRRMFRLAMEWKKVREPLARVKLLPGENHRDRVVSREEEATYLMAAPFLLRDVATILMDCGLRPEECFRLRWENVRDGAIHITFGKTKASRRRIPTTDRVTAMLERRRLELDFEWVFPAPTRSGHIESSSLKKQQSRAFRVTEIEPFVLYSLRHTCLTRWAPHMDPYTLGYLAGHCDMNITRRYVHPNDETVHAAFERAKSTGSPPKSPPSPRLEDAAFAEGRL